LLTHGAAACVDWLVKDGISFNKTSNISVICHASAGIILAEI
jgi:hypothetical protein